MSVWNVCTWPFPMQCWLFVLTYYAPGVERRWPCFQIKFESSLISWDDIWRNSKPRAWDVFLISPKFHGDWPTVTKPSVDKWWTDFHDLFRKGRTWEKEHFRDLVVNDSLNPGSICLFSGSVFVSNIKEKRMNGFSWNFHDMSGRTKEVII